MLTHTEPRRECVAGRIGQRDETVPVAFAADRQHTSIAGERAQRQSDEFGDAEPRSIQNFQQRDQAQSLRAPTAGSRSEQLLDLLFGEILRQRLGLFWAIDRQRRIFLAQSLGKQKTKKLPKRR